MTDLGVAKGKIQYVDEDLIGYTCECGEEMVLTSGEERECYYCKKIILGTVKVEVYEIEKGQDETNTRTG